MKLTLNKEYSVSIEHPLGKVNPFFEYWTNQSTEVQAAERIQKPVGQTSEIENFQKLNFDSGPLYGSLYQKRLILIH